MITNKSDFSVSLEDLTRGWIDKMAPTKEVSDHGTASVHSGHSVDVVDVNGRLRDFRISEMDAVSLAGDVEDTGVSPENHRSGSVDPFSTGKKRTNDWIRSKSPEELREIRVAVEKALKQGVEGGVPHGRTRRRLSKKHQFKPKPGDANADLFQTLTLR